MQIRGWLRRKIIENRKSSTPYDVSKELDNFRLASNSSAFIAPISRKVEDIDIKYPLIEPFAYAHINYNPDSNSLIYSVIEPAINNREKTFYKDISLSLTRTLEINLDQFFKDAEANATDTGDGILNIETLKRNQILKYLKEKVKEIVVKEGMRLKQGEITRVMYYIYRDFIGLNQLEPLLSDPYIEDIGCDGVGVPIYIQHKRYGSIRSNVVFNGYEKTADFVIKLAERCGSYVTYAEPLLDGSLPDGSRVNATFTKDITTKGPTFSIRRFAKVPYSCIDLIKNHTSTSDIFAYIWYVIEHQKNFLVVGTTSSGKTSFLNSILAFIPFSSKIVSIEDTRELHLLHENWIPSVSRESFGSSGSDKENYGEVSMFDLLKESFRQNPDYVVVGEVRGIEASVLFQGMASGHASFSTMHAGSVKDILERLTTPPISLSGTLVEALDVVIILQHAMQIGINTRRVREVSEVVSVDAKTMKIDTTVPFKWQPSTDEFLQRNSLILERLGVEFGIDSKNIYNEIKTRKIVLEWMLKNNITRYDEVSEIITIYYNNRQKLYDIMKAKIRFTHKGMVSNHYRVDIGQEIKKTSKVIPVKNKTTPDKEDSTPMEEIPTPKVEEQTQEQKEPKPKSTKVNKKDTNKKDIDNLLDKASFTKL